MFSELKGMKNMQFQFDPESFPHANIREAGRPSHLHSPVPIQRGQTPTGA